MSAPRAPAAADDSLRSLATGTRWLTLATLVVGGVNYGYALVLTRLLSPSRFAVYGAGQALLLSVGTVATASIPWVLAEGLVKARTPEDRRRAVLFALVINLGLGLVAGVLVAALGLQFAGPAVALVLLVSTVLILLASTPQGWLQGERRLGAAAVLRVTEVLVKVAAGGGLVVIGGGAAAALSGFGWGAGVVVVAGLVLLRGDLGRVHGALRSRGLWRSAFGIGGVQALVSVFAALDVVLVAVLPVTGSAAGSYQAAVVLARVPLFFGGAVAVAAFPLLSRADRSVPDVIRTSYRLYAVLGGSYTVVVATLPSALSGRLFPASYVDVGRLLPLLAVSGFGLGLVNVVTTFFQSLGRYRTSMATQLVGLAVHVTALLVGYALGGTTGIAAGSALGSITTATLLVVQTRRIWQARLPLALPAGVLVLLVLMAAARPLLALWAVPAVVLGLVAVRALLRTQPGRGAGAAPGDRPRVLHLAYEDHRRPGSGGGAVRSREINRRLSDMYDLTAVVSSWPGCQDRVEDGVRYVHVGLRRGGRTVQLLSYFLALPAAVRKHPADLVVEDFAAPIGSALVPLYARGPVLAVVQWLAAHDKARQYHLPVGLFEDAGVRLHDRYVAVSQQVAEQLRRRHPGARVDVIANGVPGEAFDVVAPRPRGRDVVFLGRLEQGQKGLDLLLEAWERHRDRWPGRLLLAGDGPAEALVRREIQRRGLTGQVELLGRLDDGEKFALLARAAVVAMPSRYETFGMVALEAFACRTPVVAFAIPALAELVTDEVGRTVPPFDVPAFADALFALALDADEADVLGERGARLARGYRWDELAARQAAAYRAALAGDRVTTGFPRAART